MIPRRELIAKVDQISLLEMRIAEQVAEFQYQKQQGESSHSEQMHDIHENYCSALEELKVLNDSLKALHVDQLNELTTTITKSNEKHQRDIEKLEANFNDKIIIEFENQKLLKQRMSEMREDYEEKLQKSTGCLQETIGNLSLDSFVFLNYL